MKKRNSLKIIMGVLLIIALMSATAFAAVGQPSAEGSVAETLTLE